jgi:glycine cleavage system aminomethyltransferase T
MPAFAHACILNSDGKFVDDCVIYHAPVNQWLVVHGTGTGMEQLTTALQLPKLCTVFDDDLHDMSARPRSQWISIQNIISHSRSGVFWVAANRCLAC